METLESVSQGINGNNWTASLDLKDAYFHVPIHRDHWQYLHFCIESQCYQYKVLPFGLTTSPRGFTKILAPVIRAQRLQGIRAFPYLDDILLTTPSRRFLEAHVQQALSILTQAGFVINLLKSSLTPTQDMVFLNTHFQSTKNLPHDKAFSL